MNKNDIIITPNAQKNINDIVDYICYELTNLEAAVRFVKMLYEKIEKLCIFPRAYPLVDREPWRSKWFHNSI